MKVLIISYHFTPMNAVASYRAKAYADYLHDHNIYPTVITEKWDYDEINAAWLNHDINTKVEITENSHFRLIRVPRYRTKIGKAIDFISRIPLMGKAMVLWLWLWGYLDSGGNNMDTYLRYKSFLFEYLQHHKFDVVVGIFSPHHHIRLCAEINKKFQIPYIIDFRDLWDNRIIHQHYHPKFKERLQDHLIQRSWKKWLSNAKFFVTTSGIWRQKLEQLFALKGHVVTNGFEEEFRPTANHNTTQFRMVHVGSLYAHQKLHLLLEGINLFLKGKNQKEVQIDFIGADRRTYEPSINGFLQEPTSLLSKFIDKGFINITKWLAKESMKAYYQNSQVLLFPSFPDSPGTYSAKIFEYLATGKNILVVPSDGHVVTQLIDETKAGYIANSPQEVAEYLNRLFKEWKEKGTCSYYGDEQKINVYSRKNQTAIMASLVAPLIQTNKQNKIV